MKKFKHSKIKNTAILFELLSKQVTADVLSETSNKSLPMIRKYFNSKTELGKELACYHIVTEAIGKRESSANKILELAVQHRKRLDVKKLAREKYNLISELRTVYDIDMFFESRVSNYRLYAALYKMFEYDSSDNPTAHVESYETILEHMTSTPKANMISEGKKMYSESESPELQALTFKMIVEKFSPALYNSLGIFLPLIAVNCAILGASLFMQEREYADLAQTTVFGLGSGVGFFLAIAGIAAIREKLRYSNVPDPLKGLGITFIITGLMAIAFMGFMGITL